MEKKTLTTSKAVIYAAGIFGVQILIGYINSFQTEFYNKMYSAFDPNIFFAAAVIIFVAKVISCIFDPLIGSLIDKSDLPGGKMRPWILRSAFPLAILTTLIFVYIPFDAVGGVKGKVLLYAYITVTTVLWNIAMSFADIPSQGLLSLLSPSAEERNMAAGFSNIGKSIGLYGPGVAVTIVMIILNAIHGQGNYPDKEYYLVTALFLMCVGLFCILLMYRKNEETVVSTNAKNAVSFKDMFLELKNHKMMTIVLLINLLGFARAINAVIVVQLNGAVVGWIDFFGVRMDTTADASWAPGLLGGISGFIGIIVIPFICKKIGEKKAYIIFSILQFVFGLAVTIFYCLLPAGHALRYGNPALYFILIVNFISGFLMCVNTYIPLVITADIVDYYYWKTGTRNEGVDYAILSMSIKLGNALCVVFGLLMVALSGYTQVAYAAGAVTPHMQNVIMIAFYGCGPFSAFLSCIPMFWYKIDGSVKTDMRAALKSENN